MKNKNKNKSVIVTPKSYITSLLRSLWLESKERTTALKRDKYTCTCCGRKQSKAKGKEFSVEVHHKVKSINWDRIVALLRQELLCCYSELETLCKDCHKKLHKEIK